MTHLLALFIMIMIIITAPIWVPVLIIALLHGIVLCAQLVGAAIMLLLVLAGA